jgi:hypothetical protein
MPKKITTSKTPRCSHAGIEQAKCVKGRRRVLLFCWIMATAALIILPVLPAQAGSYQGSRAQYCALVGCSLQFVVDIKGFNSVETGQTYSVNEISITNGQAKGIYFNPQGKDTTVGVSGISAPVLSELLSEGTLGENGIVTLTQRLPLFREEVIPNVSNGTYAQFIGAYGISSAQLPQFIKGGNWELEVIVLTSFHVDMELIKVKPNGEQIQDTLTLDCVNPVSPRNFLDVLDQENVIELTCVES